MRAQCLWLGGAAIALACSCSDGRQPAGKPVGQQSSLSIRKETALGAEALVGISAIQVSLSLSDVAEEAAGGEQAIRTAIELRLRRAGIRVDENADPSATAFLYYSCTAVKDDFGTVAHASSIAASRLMHFDSGGTQYRTFAIPWRHEKVGQAGKLVASQSIKSSAEDLTDAFLNAWLSANPKE